VGPSGDLRYASDRACTEERPERTVVFVVHFLVVIMRMGKL
jgi:hypothetical protein